MWLFLNHSNKLSVVHSSFCFTSSQLKSLVYGVLPSASTFISNISYSLLSLYFGGTLFLVDANNMLKTAICDIFHFVDDSCLVCQQKAINKIEKQLYEGFFGYL